MSPHKTERLCLYILAEALKTATYNPALYFNMEGKAGTVESGKVADLVLLNDNPLTDIRNIENVDLVIRNGKILFRKLHLNQS